ncbi:FtsH protease activity modulator HflK [Elongatibacter sediminis]|uniref:Protein HflK n=1 Tax=Elongatibacter sediminis TaxID=3119006 RepID=A0AAW9RFA2_9GAMM
MPWKEPGKGNKDPWSSGDEPPDLEEVFRNVNRRLKSLFGGGGGGRGGRDSSGAGSGGLISVLVIAALLWVGWDSVHIVDEAERGVVLRFGKYSRTLDPGLNLTLPRPFETTIPVNVSNVRSVEDRGQMLTEDENIVELNYTVQYRVLDPQKFLFNVRDPEPTLQGAAESALRESLGTNGLDTILAGAGREKISQNTEVLLQDMLDLYSAGIQITEFTLKDVNVPMQVREAFSDVNRAREDRQRFIEEARVHVNSVVPEARGQAARILQEAEGYKQATIALAEGEAERFSLLLKEYQKAPAITRKRLYLQTMENVFGRSNKILLDADSSGNVLYLPLDQLGGGGGTGAGSLMPPLVGPDNRNESADSGSNRNPRREGRQ